MAAAMIAGAVQYPQVVQGTGAEREKNIAEITKAIQAFSFLTGDVTSLGTIGGYVTTRLLGLVPTMLALWALIVGAGLVRGEEQQGPLDVLMSMPLSRLRVLTEKAAALGLAVVVTSALTVLGLWLGIVGVSEQADVGGLALVELDIAAVVGFLGSFGSAGRAVGGYPAEGIRSAGRGAAGLLPGE
jgi:ABC-2 type transport system permease protein